MVAPLNWKRMSELSLLIPQETILKKIIQVAQEIQKEDLQDELVIIMVMKGAICLVADLIRHLSIPCMLESIHASSYGLKGVNRGELTISGIERLNITGKRALIVDDIFDTGHTLSVVTAELQKLKPKTLKSLVLLSKKKKRSSSFAPNYVLFEIEDEFVVGYGLDHKEKYRNLPGIYIFQPSK